MGSSVVSRALGAGAPSAGARKPATPGLRVADLKQRGPAALDDAQMKRLLVGKTLVMRKTVTGQRFEILFGVTGWRLVTSVDGKAPQKGEVSNVLHGGEMGSPADYRHHDVMRRQP
jgi:hypothetical protein